MFAYRFNYIFILTRDQLSSSLCNKINSDYTQLSLYSSIYFLHRRVYVANKLSRLIQTYTLVAGNRRAHRLRKSSHGVRKSKRWTRE